MMELFEKIDKELDANLDSIIEATSIEGATESYMYALGYVQALKDAGLLSALEHRAQSGYIDNEYEYACKTLEKEARRAG